MRAHADGEVLLCAGAVQSPHILQLSGIGDGEALKAAGVQPVHDLPGRRREPAGPPGRRPVLGHAGDPDRLFRQQGAEPAGHRPELHAVRPGAGPAELPGGRRLPEVAPRPRPAGPAAALRAGDHEGSRQAGRGEGRLLHPRLPAAAGEPGDASGCARPTRWTIRRSSPTIWPPRRIGGPCAKGSRSCATWRASRRSPTARRGMRARAVASPPTPRSTPGSAGRARRSTTRWAPAGWARRTIRAAVVDGELQGEGPRGVCGSSTPR